MRLTRRLDTAGGQAHDLPALVGERAGNLFLSRKMSCSQAVLVTLNRGLGGGLDESQALALSAPFAEGIGNSGCMCGALAGALMGLGLLMGGAAAANRHAYYRQAAAQLIAGFKLHSGSACCRVLSRKGDTGSASRYTRCSKLTAQAAALAAAAILEQRPDLARAADRGFLEERDSTIGGLIRQAFNPLSRACRPL